MPDHENGELSHAPWQAGTSVFIAAIVVSAALLFMVEPMFTRMVLPRFGGSASVWSVAIAFFQGALLLGYLYAHGINRALSVRAGVIVHLAVLAIGALWLPLSLHGIAGGAGGAGSLIGVFTLSLAPPFIALSANAPLLQAWFSRSGVVGAQNPYPLYAASNAGSLLALLAYPILVEPTTGLAMQARDWSIGYACLIALVACAGWIARNGGRAEVVQARAPLAMAQIARWIFFALVPSAGLVAVTSHLSTDVAAAPFLWVAPLALYLLTFVIVFRRPNAGAWVEWLAAPALIGLAAVVGMNLRFGIGWDVLIHLGGFFILALACHTQLSSLRPDVGNLTAFYLAMSFGGMLGGVLAALVAPAVFSFVAEYPLVISAAALALKRARWPVAATVAALLVAGQLMPLDVRSRQTTRSFFGVHTVEVTRDGQFRTLRHGLEIHGVQRITTREGAPVTGKPLPLAYYHDDSPISEAIDAMRAARGGRALRVGVVGLGTGAIACLTEPGDTLDYYEIDPAVISIARDTAKFSFLAQCAPGARIIQGDARQTLAASTAQYDILIVDAFSSDAIPAHLLTEEAFGVYVARLTGQGVAVIHISNNHLRLQDIVAATARPLGLEVRLYDEESDDNAASQFIYQPTVVALARTSGDFGALGTSDEWITPPITDTRPWTDDYSNLFGALVAKLREH